MLDPNIFKKKVEEVLEEPEKPKEPEPEKPEYQKILEEHGGLESNIGIGHHYWRIRP